MSVDLDEVRALRPTFGAPGSTVNRILQAAWLTAGRKGTKKLSISVICKAAKVSRATFYRHFSTKEEVLSTLSEFVSYSFVQGLRDAVAGRDDPLDILREVLGFHWRLSEMEQTSGMFDVEPEYVINFLRAHFPAHVEAMAEALEPVFDYFEGKRATKLNRRRIAEAIVRLGLSTVLIPSDGLPDAAPMVLMGLVEDAFGPEAFVASPRSRLHGLAGD